MEISQGQKSTNIDNDKSKSETKDGVGRVDYDLEGITRRVPDADVDRGSHIEDAVNSARVQPTEDYKLSKTAVTYELEKFKKNVLLIFNNKFFNKAYLTTRYGTESDQTALTETFERYGFEVIPCNDCTKQEILDVLKIFFKRDFTAYGCIAIAVLTHGSKNGQLWAKDEVYNEVEIVKYFQVNHQNPTLITKPKLLIVQACRGELINEGIRVNQMDNINPRREQYSLPAMADIMLVHSTYVNNPSYRNVSSGSWFIQSLCKKINQLAPVYDFEYIVLEMRRDVAIQEKVIMTYKEYLEDFKPAVASLHRSLLDKFCVSKQLPVSTSTLVRKLYLKRFEEEPPRVIGVEAAVVPSTDEVADGSLPEELLQYQIEPCTCFLEHFEYAKNCLRLYIDTNPDDKTASGLMEVASVFEDSGAFNAAKEVMLKNICEYLKDHAKEAPYFKYLHLL